MVRRGGLLFRCNKKRRFIIRPRVPDGTIDLPFSSLQRTPRPSLATLTANGWYQIQTGNCLLEGAVRAQHRRAAGGFLGRRREFVSGAAKSASKSRREEKTGAADPRACRGPLNSHLHASISLTNNSFRPGPATDYYGSFKVERSQIEPPPCDADNEETAKQLMDGAAKLGIKVRAIAQGRGARIGTCCCFVSASKKIEGSGMGVASVSICVFRTVRFCFFAQLESS